MPRAPMTHARPISRTVDDGHLRWEIAAPERIGPPLGHRRRSRVLRTLALIAAIAGGGWLWLDGRLAWMAPLATEAVKLIATSDRSPQSSPSAPAAQVNDAALPVLALLDPSVMPEVATPAVNMQPIVTPETPVSREPATAHPEQATTAPAPYTPPPPATDPLTRRAQAAGLHPGLSRVLLERLSPDDYRNAQVAIRKALAETPDDGALEWPRTTSAKLAQFRVHFAAGAGERCRRYVVTIAKDGWLTTALPMERCGVKPPALKTG